MSTAVSSLPTPPRSARRRSVVALAGDWRCTGVAEELGAHHDIVPVHDAAEPPAGPVDWLLVSPGTRPGEAERLVAALRAASPALRVVVVEPGESLRCDVRVPRSARPGDLVTAMRLAQEGFAVARRPRAPHPGRGLTDRETELLGALCAGLGNEQIARRMRISRRTVEFHLTRIFRKLGVGSRAEAIVHAQRSDLVP